MRWRGGAIEQCARQVELEPKSKTEPLGLGFGQGNGGGGSFLGRVDPIWQAYTGFEVVGWCDRAMREGGLSWSQNAKQSRRGSVLANKTWGHSFSGRGGPIGVEWTGFNVVGASNWVRQEGGLSWGQNPRPSGQGSVLANEMRERSFSSRGDPIRVGYTVF